MRRVLLHGVTGSGKSTLATAIAERAGLPMISVDDQVGWMPHWQMRSPEEQRAIVRELIAAPTWVMDSSYGAWRELPLTRADTVIALDYPRWLSLGRLLRRTLARSIDGREICNGNRETLRRGFLDGDSILVWHFRSFARKRATIRAWEADPPVPSLVVLRSPRQTRRWLAGLERPPRADLR